MRFERKTKAGRKDRRGRPRKPKGQRGVPHQTRQPVSRRTPVHATWRLVREARSVRRFKAFRVLAKCVLLASTRFPGFRIVHFSLQRDHLHVIAEAENAQILSKGMQGFGVRVTRNLNPTIGHTGSLIADRFHYTVANTPAQARHIIAYVLNNARKHHEAPHHQINWIDPFSSARWFDGFEGVEGLGSPGQRPPPDIPCPVSAPRSWLLSTGWKKHGLIKRWEVPSSKDR